MIGNRHVFVISFVVVKSEKEFGRFLLKKKVKSNYEIMFHIVRPHHFLGGRYVVFDRPSAERKTV